MTHNEKYGSYKDILRERSDKWVIDNLFDNLFDKIKSPKELFFRRDMNRLQGV